MKNVATKIQRAAIRGAVGVLARIPATIHVRVAGVIVKATYRPGEGWRCRLV